MIVSPGPDVVPEPWPQRARVALLVANAVVAALLVVAWAGAADTEELRDQIGWLNLAVIGCVASAATNAAWLMAGRRAVGERRRRLLADVVVPISVADQARQPERTWRWVPGTRRAHLVGCPLQAGRHAVDIDAAHIVAQRLERCELCGSDGT